MTDELGDVSCSDDHGVDSGALELVHLLTGRGGHIGDGEFPGRDIRQELERAAERVFLVVFGTAEQEDLRIETLECQLELVLVAHLDHTVESELERFRLQRFELAVVFVICDDEQTRVRARAHGCVGGACAAPQQRQLRRVADAVDRGADDDCLRTLSLGGACGFDVVHLDEHRDPVPFRDRLAESACGHRSRREA